MKREPRQKETQSACRVVRSIFLSSPDVFKTMNNCPPEYLRDQFWLRDNIKNLRGVNMLQVPKPNTTRYGKNSVKYLAAITWNKISDTVRSLSTLSDFKKAVRQLRFSVATSI